MLKDNTAFSSYSTNDMAKTKDFYTNVLGVEASDNWMGLHLKLPGGHEVFIYEKEGHQPASYTVLNFMVDDIDKTVEEMAANGVMFERYDSMPAEQDEKGILRGKESNMGPDIAWFKDPAGNILAVLQN